LNFIRLNSFFHTIFSLEAKNVEIIKADERCKGGWHYGSVGRGQADIYSDYDPVFLVADKDFEQFAADVPKMLKQISDEFLICRAENYNSKFFKDFCLLFKSDAEDIYRRKGIEYPETVSRQVI
jgi:hypothetical protein